MPNKQASNIALRNATLASDSSSWSSINLCNLLAAICAGLICGISGTGDGPEDKSASSNSSCSPPKLTPPKLLNVAPGCKSFPSPG